MQEWQVWERGGLAYELEIDNSTSNQHDAHASV